jgi:hypothetical protein
MVGMGHGLSRQEDWTMGEPKLYEHYDRDGAIALFGPEAEARSLCDSQWVIFPGVVLCLAEIGEPPGASHFTNGSGFCWVAGQPYRVSDEHVTFVPREVVGGHARRQAIHLFVRKEGSGRYLYVGQLGPACRFSLAGGGNHGEAHFDLSQVLPSEVWAKIGDFRPGDLDHAALDAALDRLSQPIDVDGASIAG